MNKNAISGSVLVLALAGCGSGAPDDGRAESMTRQAVTNGTDAPPDHLFTVRVLNVCGGTLIAPNLVATARHCISEYENKIIYCDPADPITTLGNLVKDTIPVWYGHQTKPSDPPSAYGVEFFSPNENDICYGDLTIMKLDRDLSPPPVTLRLDRDEPLVSGETVSVTGWGAISEEAYMPDTLQTRETEYLSSGFTYYKQGDYPAMPVPEGQHIIGEGACNGDSGSPVIRKSTGAVIGSVTRVGNLDPYRLDPLNFKLPIFFPWCGDGSIAMIVDFTAEPYRQLIVDALKSNGTSVSREARPAPFPLGETCEEDLDCENALCLETAAGKVCSVSCDANPCPEASGATCRPGPDGTGNYCLLEQPAAETDDGCTIGASKRRDPSSELWLLLAAGVLAASRRRAQGRA